MNIEQAKAAKSELDSIIAELFKLILTVHVDALEGLADRAARRPKPPSLKEQALKALDSATYQPGTDFKQIDPIRSAILRRALEQLPD